MRKSRQAFLLVLTVVLATGCGESSTDPADPVPAGPTIDDLVGSWIATSHTFTNNADPAVTFDMVANGGETRFTMLAGGGTRTWVEFGTFSDEWDAQLTMSGSTLTSTPAEASRGVEQWTFTLEGGVLTITDTTSEFDFTLSEAPTVPATSVAVFVRQ